MSSDDTDLACSSCGSENIEPAPTESQPYECVSCGALFDREYAG